MNLGSSQSKYLKRSALFATSALSVLAVFSLGSTALAQAAPQDQPAAQNQNIETITVTAEKRSQRVLDVPTSISVVTQQSIQDNTMIALSDIATRVPNVVMSGSSLFPNITIRGVGSYSGTQTGIDPAAVVYVDDVYQGRERAEDIPLDGVQQVEVLRGPQGTLYGENTIGGAINVTTFKPSDTFAANADVIAGNMGFVQATGLVSGPLNQDGADNTYASLTGFYRTHDGWIHNEVDGKNLNYDHAGGARARLVYDASARLHFDFSADYMQERDSESLLTTAYAAFIPLVFPGITPLVPNSRTESVDSPENGRRKVFGASMHVTYDFDNSTLTSISSYRGYTSAYAFDSDGTPEPIDAQNDVDNANLFTQELRLTSKDSGPFQWIMGAYYSHQRLVDDFHTIFLPQIGVLFGLPPFPSNYFDEGNSRGEIKSDSYAIYASGTWNITPRWSLAGGLRYSMDRKDLSYNQGLETLQNGFIDAAGLVLAYTPPGGETSHLRENVPTGDISLAYKIADDQSAYVKYSRGYKAGGFNAYLVTAPFDYATTGLAFKPEYLSNYEAGYKASWWDGRMTMNADVFYDKYTNKQEAVENPAALELLVENAAEARIYGAELETEIQPVDGLIFDGSLGLLNAKYNGFVSAIGGTLTGNDLPSAPHLEYTLAATYEREISNWSGWDAMARLEVTHANSSFSDPQNTVGYINGPVTYLNGRMGVSNGNWAFYLWGKNLTNQYHLTGGLFEDVATARAVNEPRTWGAELTYKF